MPCYLGTPKGRHSMCQTGRRASCKHKDECFGISQDVCRTQLRPWHTHVLVDCPGHRRACRFAPQLRV